MSATDFALLLGLGSGDTHQFPAVLRQRLGEISAPASGATRQATRTSYNLDGQVAQVDRGTVLGLADADWAAFAALESAATLYDAQGRRVRDTFSIGGVAQSVTQLSYDGAGRLECSAVRMNLGSLPANACALGTAVGNVQDRISCNAYDNAGRLFGEVCGHSVQRQT